MDLMAGVPDLTSHPQQLPQGSLLESYTWRTGHRKAPVPDVATTTTALRNAIRESSHQGLNSYGLRARD